MTPFPRLYRSAVEDTGEVEDREKYRPGGYHPIHFNDYIDSNQRFNVIHKLGWGVSSTVWLCLDRKYRLYRSVKIMTAEQSAEDCPELQIMKALGDIDQKELQENYIIIPDEYFWIEGPNGRHLCFVSELLGPNLFRNSPLGMGIHTPETLTDLTFQVSKGLQYLHQKGICHGDLRPSNILMRLHQYTLMELPDSRLDRYLGPRENELLETLSGDDPEPHGPKYLAFPASLDELERNCRTGKVAIIDFSHSFNHSSMPKSSRWHRQYAGSELLFMRTLSGLPQDIWALACTIFEIKLQTQLFSEYQDYTSLIRQMEVWFGPLPAEHRRVARTYIEIYKERRLGSESRKETPKSVSLSPEDEPTDPSQPLSMSLDEQRQKREAYIGDTGWSNHVQATLSEERSCYVYERNYMGYTSSDTDSEYSSSDSLSSAQALGDEESQGVTYLLPYDGYQEIESEENLDSEDLGERGCERSNSPPPETPVTPENQSEHSEVEEQVDAPAIPTEANLISQKEESASSRADQNPIQSPLHQTLGKRAAEESSSERETKQQRTTEKSTQKKGELVKRMVKMPREEVLLLSDLLMRMFKHDPKERIDINAVINHEFWGDRRNNWPIKSHDPIEEIPDPISSRTRSRKAEKPTDSGSP
ncbi:kinase-like domain-containing protein [Hypoxylon crocopeplum]|nr:kinase-like domain-containing protein [Hypoxylon crocopeplum]